MMLRRILVPLDGSAIAAKTLAQAGRLLRTPDSETLLVQVVDTMAMDPIQRATLLPRFRQEARDHLEPAAAKLKAAGVAVRTLVAEGLPWERILEVAGRERATMIALTSHGRTGLARWAFGSVAEKIVRASPVPTLVLPSFVPGPEGGFEPSAEAELVLRKLLVPMDGGDVGLCALEPAAELAAAYGASLVVVHVESRFDYPAGTYTARLVDAPDREPDGPPPSTLERRLDYAGRRLAARGLSVVTLRVGGDVSSRIADLPLELQADAIVMATHGRTGLSRFILGSVTEKVLRTSHRPMLIVPPAGPPG